ncbi:unnamed protein product [Leptosia nina]|uniref:RNA-directed DNA polymerase n=1 Tax=Leptosia nina TaxID=320188 RepID=A0AAV1J0T5_9NEOP
MSLRELSIKHEKVDIEIGTLFKFIKSFDGTREKLNSFLSNCDNAISLASETQKPILFKYILSQLNGKAETACSIKEFDSWDQLNHFLKTQFGETKHYTHLLADLQECRQLNIEPVNQFALRVETCLSKLLTEVTLSNKKKTELLGRTAAMEDLALHTFLLGLKPDISNLVRGKNPSTLNEAINLATSEEKILNLFAKRNSHTSVPQRQGSKPNYSFKPFPNTNARPHMPKQPDRHDPIPFCRYCKNQGHTIEVCRKREYNNNKFKVSQIPQFQQRHNQDYKPARVNCVVDENEYCDSKPQPSTTITLNHNDTVSISKDHTGNQPQASVHISKIRDHTGNQPQTSAQTSISKDHTGNQPQASVHISKIRDHTGNQPQTSAQTSISKDHTGNQPQASVHTSKIRDHTGNQPQTSAQTSKTRDHTGKQPQARVQYHSKPTKPVHKILENEEIYEISSIPNKMYLPYVVVQTSVANKPLRFLVDTGSSICLIQNSSIESFSHLLLKGNIIKIKGINSRDDTMATLGDFDMNLIFGKESIPFTFHIIEQVHLPYDGIIGNDLLTRFQCSVDYNRQILNLEKNKIKLNFTDPTYQIPPRSEITVECSVVNPELKEGLILDQHISETLFIANCLVRVKSNNRINLTVLNTSETPVKLNSNLLLTLHPVDFEPCLSNYISNKSCLDRTNEVLNLLRVSHLNTEEREALYDLCSNYSDIFHLPNDILTSTDAIQHEIRTSSDQPINVKSYRFPEVHKEEEFEYEIVYRKGRLNSAADALSRYPVNPIYPENSPNSPNNDLIDPRLLDISPFNAEPYDFSPLNIPSPEYLPEPLPAILPSSENATLDIVPNSIPENIEIENQPQPSTSTEIPNILYPHPIIREPTIEPADTYTRFLKLPLSVNHDTIITEHNDSILKTQNKILIIPTSLDLDESIPYVQEILSNSSDSESFIASEKTLHSYKLFSYNNKAYYFLFTKVHHFDTCSYSDIFESIKNLRNYLISNKEPINKVSITDFKNPFDKHVYIKIYNILSYLFHNTNIQIDMYHNKTYYPSPSEVPKILRENHDIPIAGHLGSNRMFNRIREQYYWKNMRSEIETYVKNCIPCQTNKALRKINRAPMQITTTSTTAFERLSLDIVGPLPESGTAKIKYILTLQDDLTKYSVAYPIRSTTAEETSECLIHFISLFGIPKTILTDQGTNFTAEMFKETCKFLKIKQLWSSPYHPQTQGALERSHSTLKEYLKSYICENQNNWPQYVYTAMLAYNTAVHSTTNYTPYDSMSSAQEIFIETSKNTSGIYFDPIGLLKIVDGHLSVVIPIDISYIESHIKNLNGVIGSSKFLCKQNELYTDIECLNLLQPLSIRYHDIIQDFESISHLIESRPKRSAWISGVGTVFKHVFGTMDENDAIQYSNAIQLIEKDQTEISKLVKQNILVTTTTLSSFKDALNKININEQQLNSAIDTLANSQQNLTILSNSLLLKSKFNEIITILESSLLTLSFKLEDIINAPTYTDNIAIAIYDGIEDNESLSSASRGVLLADDLGGVWVGHTVPNLINLKRGQPIVPEAEIPNGHSFVCLSVDLSTVNQIVKYLRSTSAQFTHVHIPRSLHHRLPEWDFSVVPMTTLRPLAFNTAAKTLSAELHVKPPGDKQCLYKSFARAKRIVLDVYGQSDHEYLSTVCGNHYGIRNIENISLKIPDRVFYFNNMTDKMRFAVSTAAHWQRRGSG